MCINLHPLCSTSISVRAKSELYIDAFKYLRECALPRIAFFSIVIMAVVWAIEETRTPISARTKPMCRVSRMMSQRHGIIYDAFAEK